MNTEPVHPEETTWVHRLLVHLVTFVYRFPWPVLAAAVLIGAVSTYVFTTRLEYRTQRSDLLNPHKDYQQRWRQYLAEFGQDDDIVVVVEGAQRSRMQEALDVLAAEVQRQPENFDRLFYKVDLRPLHNRALLFLSSDQIAQIQENLKSMSLLLEVGPFAWQSLTLYSLFHEARDRAGKISPSRTLNPADDQFLTQLLRISQSATAALESLDRYQNPWGSLLAQPPEQKDLLAEPQYFFSGDGTLAFLLTRPVKEEGSFTADKKSVAAMHAIIAKVRPAFPELEFGLTGLPVLETDEMVASQNDTNLASWLALAGVALLYFVFFRGLRYPLLTVGTLLVGTAWASGWLTVTVGHLNILSATFAMMLIGMGDYGVLWVTRYEQDRAAGADVLTATRNTATSVGPGILTAATTTALAFYAAMLADFPAVSELGWIAGSGVLLCAFSCFTVMPALLKLVDHRRFPVPITPATRLWSASRESEATEEKHWLPILAARPWKVIGVSVIVTLVLGVCACRVYYDHNLLHLQARDLESVKWELKLIERTAGASWHALSYTTSQAEALAHKARYEQLPEVSRVVEVASLVPLEQPHKLEQLRDIQHRLQRLPERGRPIPHGRPNPSDLEAELNCLIGQLQPLADASPQPLLGELRRSLLALRRCLGETPTSAAARRLQDLEQRLATDLAEDLHRLREVSTPATITLADLPTDLRERYIGKSGKWLLRVFGKESLWDYGPLAHFVDRIHSVDAEATGKPFSTLEGLRAMKNGFLWAGIYALGAIVAVLLADFRTLRHTLVALAPLGMGMIMTLGVMGLCGWPLNPANMIAFPLIVGVGVDNGVHVLHDYLSRRTQRRAYTLSHTTGQGIMVAALTTMLGFGVLMISSHRGLIGLGFILTLGVGCCMLTALVFLPAVLRVLSTRVPKTSVEAPPIPLEDEQRAAA
jgi:hopanoid biosynthesis associated RND transporter like protein HpnN